MVLDRLFLWIFTLAVFVGTAGIILQAPTLYDDRTPIDVRLSEIASTTAKPHIVTALWETIVQFRYLHASLTCVTHRTYVHNVLRNNVRTKLWNMSCTHTHKHTHKQTHTLTPVELTFAKNIFTVLSIIPMVLIGCTESLLAVNRHRWPSIAILLDPKGPGIVRLSLVLSLRYIHNILSYTFVAWIGSIRLIGLLVLWFSRGVRLCYDRSFFIEGRLIGL